MKKYLFISISVFSLNSYSQTWSALGTGMDAGVNCITEYNGDLYAGGYFTTAGSGTVNYIAKWDGTQWSSLGTGVSGTGSFINVAAMAVYKGELYAGGIFTSAGGNAASYIAKWNGTSWSAVGTGVDWWIYCMQVYNGELYVGGSFNNAGSVSVSKIAKWNGTAWSPVFNGFSSGAEVRGLCVLNNELYAGVSNYVAKLTGSGWSTISNLNGSITCLTSDTINNTLYVGGIFTFKIYQLKNSVWSPLGTGLSGNSTVWSMYAYNNKLYVGGNFTAAGGISANNIATWDGNSWAAIGAGMNGQIGGIYSFGGSLYAVGSFTTAGTTPANRIAKLVTATDVTNLISGRVSINIFPNPFSTHTTFTLSKEVKNTLLKIYDLSGKAVKIINFSGKQITLERENLSSGIYFYQICLLSLQGEGKGEVISAGKIIVQ